MNLDIFYWWGRISSDETQQMYHDNIITPKTLISIVQTNSVKLMSVTQALNPIMQGILIRIKWFLLNMWTNWSN